MKSITNQYLEAVEKALKMIRQRVMEHAVKDDNNFTAWGQHIDKPSLQRGIYGTTAALEMLDLVDADESYNKLIPQEVEKALRFLEKLFKDESAFISAEGPSKYQLAILPKLRSILSCLSLRLINKTSAAKEVRNLVITRIKSSQNSDGGWPVYYPKLIDEDCTEILPSDPLITAAVLSAVVKSEVKDEINFQKVIDYLMDSLNNVSLPLHTQLYAIYAIRASLPEQSIEFIKNKSKEIIDAFDNIYPNILEVYHPFDVTDTKENKTTAHYFVVKQKTLLLNYLSRFERNRFYTKKWLSRALDAVNYVIEKGGGEESKISFRIGTRNTLSAVHFLIQSKKSVKENKWRINLFYYGTKILHSIKTRYSLIGILLCASLWISPFLSPGKGFGFFWGVIAGIIAAIIYSIAFRRI